MIGAPALAGLSHLDPHEVPLALADLHARLAIGARVRLQLGFATAAWPVDRLGDVLLGAGFGEPRLVGGTAPTTGHRGLVVEVERRLTLPDTVRPRMRLLVCGLNPSVYSAERGIGFARPGNRFWPAALAAGLTDRDRDTRRALADHGLGMTDLVKRATARADELEADEYRVGLARVRRLVTWLQPGAVCFVGLAGWRSAVDRRAVAGHQAAPIGGVPVYLMPSTSGLNAHSSVADLTDHLRAAAALADAARPQVIRGTAW